MSFIFLLIYVFCTIIRPQDWVPGIMALPIVDVLTGIIVFSLLMERLGAKQRIFLSVPQNKMMAGLFIAIILSHVVHTYVEGLIFSFSSFLVIFVLYFLLLNGVNSEAKFKIVIWSIVLMILALVFQGMYQADNGLGWADQPLTRDFDTLRINWVGIFSDPNDLALIFVMAIGILIASLFGQSNFIQKILMIPMVGYLIYGIYLTNSRGGFLALMATVFFYFVKRSKKFILGGIIGALLAGGIFALGPSRMGLMNAEEDSAQGRINLWYEGILLMKSNPVFGVGYGMFMEDLPQTAHNSYILAGAELGIIGLFFWVGLIYISYRGLSDIQKASDRLKSYAYGLQSSLIGFSSAAFFLSRTYIVIPYMIFALSGALMHIAMEQNIRINLDITKRDVRNIFLLSVGILLLAYILVKIGI